MDSYLMTLGSVSAFKFNLKRNLVKDFIEFFSILSCHQNFSVSIFLSVFSWFFELI